MILIPEHFTDRQPDIDRTQKDQLLSTSSETWQLKSPPELNIDSNFPPKCKHQGFLFPVTID